jgi:predicted O-linked N-acetylglucosamine transferase (SPINDLY family)
MLLLVERARESLLLRDPAEAVRLIEQVLETDPEHAEALHVAGLAAGLQGRFEDAIDLLLRALQNRPEQHSWLKDLGMLQCATCRWSEAARTLERAADAGPLPCHVLHAYAVACLESGAVHQAENVYRQILKREPASAETLYGLGRALRAAGELDRAVESLEQSLAADPELVDARIELAEVLGICHYPYLELEYRRQVAMQKPDDPEAALWLVRAEFQTGNLTASMRRMIGLLQAELPAALQSELLHMLLHDQSQTGHSLRIAHQRWGKTFAALRQKGLVHDNERDPERRLRVGYVCGEFVSAPSFHFLLPLLRYRRRNQFEVTCYQTGFKKDDRTAIYKSDTDHWRDAANATDEELSTMIRDDEIDILVDLGGHYDHHRLQMFARRPAPVQATFPNYPCTSGVAAIDYILTDRWVCPLGSEHQYTETPARVASGYLTYLPPRAPELIDLPAGEKGPLTFGIFQRPAKFQPSFWDAVAQVLLECPGATLLLQHGAGELDLDESAPRRHFRQILASRGVRENRIRFRGPLTRDENLEFFAQADIVLDTFPYNGQTTTCECLWMGVPVITLAGEYHVARVGHSILSRIGLPELVACDVREYVRLATALARDRQHLTELRQGLRERLQSSSLLDGRSVVGVENEYRRIWREWCGKGSEGTHNDQ